METEGSLVSTTFPYPKQARSSQYHHALLPEDPN